MTVRIPRVSPNWSLFHYSTQPVSELQSLNLREGTKSKTDREYRNNISFFFDPIPSKKIVSLFPADHSFWKKGNKIYEHVVDCAKIPQKAMLAYWIAESKAKTAFMDEFVKAHNWVDDDPELLKAYQSQLQTLQTENGEYGDSKFELLNQVVKNKKTTEAAFIQAAQRSDFSENSHKYAANVPHLMLYVKAPIQVAYVNELTLGSDSRTILI